MKKFYGLPMVLLLIITLTGCGGGGGGKDTPPGGNGTTIVEGSYKLVINVTGKGHVETTKLEPYNGFACYDLLAVPDTGYHFLRWEGDDYSGTQNPLCETINKDITETAVFVDPIHFVAGTWDCYAKTEFTFTFREDKTFSYQYDDDAPVSGTWYLDDDGDFIDIYFNNAYDTHYTGTIDFNKRKITGYYASTVGSGSWSGTRRD
jgi:hypothetical protein